MSTLRHLPPALACPLGMALLLRLMLGPQRHQSIAARAIFRRETAAVGPQMSAWHSPVLGVGVAAGGAHR